MIVTVQSLSAYNCASVFCVLERHKKKKADFEQCKDKLSPLPLPFCVSYSVEAKWELKSWTDCVYTLSSALGDTCHGANALCWLCVWHSYITNTSHWGP